MIREIFDLIVDNREWVFSGIGVTLFLGVVGLFRKKKKTGGGKCYKIHQENSGQNSTQIGIQNNYNGGKNDV